MLFKLNLRNIRIFCILETYQSLVKPEVGNTELAAAFLFHSIQFTSVFVAC